MALEARVDSFVDAPARGVILTAEEGISHVVLPGIDVLFADGGVQ